MPNNPKCFIHGTVLDVTFRTEHGLPLVASEYMQVILKGIFARAQTLYPVTICHFLVMANHIHMILVVKDPGAVAEFVGTIKKESAHAVNRLLGRRMRTVWCDGYDSAQILDPDKVVERIVYIYTNPQRANLEDRIEQYPNFNSWQVFLRGGAEHKVRRIPRSVISMLPNTTLTLAEQKRIAIKLLEDSVYGGMLFVEPDAWLNCFEETKGGNAERYKRETIAKIRAEENRLAAMRKRPVLGAEELRLQPIHQDYVPKKFGRRMICLSSFKELRGGFIGWYKERFFFSAGLLFNFQTDPSLRKRSITIERQAVRSLVSHCFNYIGLQLYWGQDRSTHCRMPNNPKCFIHRTVLDVTFRTEQGLPLVASEYMQIILKGIFARAQTLHPVTICHFLVMANHIHMILVVKDPAAVKDFVGTIKRESAHAINRFGGRRKRTIWCDGYDSVPILDPDKVVERIVYIYTNPQKANLEEKIERYPNFNTWEAFVKGGAECKVRRVPRNRISKLPKTTMTLAEQKRFAAKLLEDSVYGGVLYIEPDAWLDCFAETEDADAERYKREIIATVRHYENRFAKLRKHPVLGAKELCLEPIDRAYVPKKFGRRMICLSSFRELRIAFIGWYKERCSEATKAIARWKLGDWHAKPPPGFFLPGGFLHANVNPATIF